MQIVDVDDPDREKEASRHFLSHLLFRQDLLKAMGMDSLTWVIMEAQKAALGPGPIRGRRHSGWESSVQRCSGFRARL
jgi:hypothetical protein